MTVAKIWDGTKFVPVVGAQGPVGPQGAKGDTGNTGAKGDPGGPVPVGGAINQLLAKKTAADGDTQWVNPPVTGITGQTYAITAGYVKDRAMNPQAMTLGEVAAVLATLVDDMIAAGLIKP